MPIERTLVIIKPDAFERRLSGKILDRFLSKGLKLTAMKMDFLTTATAEKLYSPHKGKSFYGALIEFMTSGPVVACVFESENAVNTVRALLGSTDAASAQPGTIRGDLGLSTRYNLVHGSDSQASAEREIKIFFSSSKSFSYEQSDGKWFGSKEKRDRTKS